MDFDIIIDALIKALKRKDYKLIATEIGNTVNKYQLQVYGDEELYNRFKNFICDGISEYTFKKIKGLECIKSLSIVKSIFEERRFYNKEVDYGKIDYGCTVYDFDSKSFWLGLFITRYKASNSKYPAIRNLDFNLKKYSFLKTELLKTKDTEQTIKYLKGDPELGKVLDCTGCIKIENSSHRRIINDILKHHGEIFFSALCRAMILSTGGWGTGFNINKTTYWENFKYDPKTHEISFDYRMYNSAWKEL